MMEGAARGSDERDSNNCFGGCRRKWEGYLFLVRSKLLRKTDGQPDRIVVPNRKLRPDFKFDPLIPDPT